MGFKFKESRSAINTNSYLIIQLGTSSGDLSVRHPHLIVKLPLSMTRHFSLDILEAADLYLSL